MSSPCNVASCVEDGAQCAVPEEPRESIIDKYPEPQASKEDFPSDWTYRTVTVAGQSRTFEVPRYIVRIDSPPGAPGATHGWQVRYDRSATKLFSDSRCAKPGRVGTPDDSLRAAMEFLRAKWRGAKPPVLPREQRRKQHPTGMSGVRVVWRNRNGLRQCYVRVDDLQGRPLKAFYVGTENTVRASSLARKVREAVKLRQSYLREQGTLTRRPPRAAPRP